MHRCERRLVADLKGSFRGVEQYELLHIMPLDALLNSEHTLDNNLEPLTSGLVSYCSGLNGKID